MILIILIAVYWPICYLSMYEGSNYNRSLAEQYPPFLIRVINSFGIAIVCSLVTGSLIFSCTV